MKQPEFPGMVAAVEHADRVVPSWSDQALQMVKDFPGSKFTAQEVRHWAEGERGLPAAPSARAWGAVIRRAHSGGLIKRTGYTYKKQEGTSNPSPVALWERKASRPLLEANLICTDCGLLVGQTQNETGEDVERPCMRGCE